MKVLYLTSLVIIPSDKGKQKIEKALERNKSGVKTDENGKTREWYEDIGIPVPEGLFEDEEEDTEIDEDGMMFLQADELEYDYLDLLIPLKQFSSVEDDQELGSILTTKNGKEFHIEETAEEVLAYINFLDISFLQNLKIKLINYFKRFKSTNTQKLN